MTMQQKYDDDEKEGDNCVLVWFQIERDNRQHHADASTTWMKMTLMRMVRMMRIMIMAMITIQQTTLSG